MPAFDVDALRAEFPALARRQDGRPVVYLDGPGGTQVPQRVIDAVVALLPRHQRERRGRVRHQRAERRDGARGARGRRRLPGRGQSGRGQVRSQHVHLDAAHRPFHRRDARAGRRDRGHHAGPRGERVDLAGDGRRPRRNRPDGRHPPRRRDARPRGPRIEAELQDEAGRHRLCQQRRRDRQPGTRDRGPRARGGRAGLCRRGRLRTTRPDRRPGARLRLPRLLGLQVVRAASRGPVRQGRSLRSPAGVQGPARARPVRDRDCRLRIDRGHAGRNRLPARRRPELRRRRQAHPARSPPANDAASWSPAWSRSATTSEGSSHG